MQPMGATARHTKTQNEIKSNIEYICQYFKEKKHFKNFSECTITQKECEMKRERERRISTFTKKAFIRTQITKVVRQARLKSHG